MDVWSFALRIFSPENPDNDDPTGQAHHAQAQIKAWIAQEAAEQQANSGSTASGSAVHEAGHTLTLSGAADGLEPQNSTPFSKDQTDSARSDIASLLGVPRCANFMKGLLKRLGEITERGPYSTDPLIIFEEIARQGGLFLGSGSGGGSTGGTLEQGTADIRINGLDPNSLADQIGAGAANDSTSFTKFDEYGDLSVNEEKKRLADLALQLRSNTNQKGFIIAYGGRRTRIGEAQARAARAKNYLVDTLNIQNERIAIISGGYREELSIDLVVGPSDRGAPSPSPTVCPSEVQIIKGGKMSRDRRRRVSVFHLVRVSTKSWA